MDKEPISKKNTDLILDIITMLKDMKADTQDIKADISCIKSRVLINETINNALEKGQPRPVSSTWWWGFSPS
tara:strand:- start:13431 stop:13646 length:216 start_codon:yes stop_codon:yes gene_type:complete